MNRTIRGMAGLLVALGASACANDWSLDYETPPTQIFASPAVMFVTQGDSAQLLLRLTNDINQSVPAKFDVSNVPNGLVVTHDDSYRPDYVNPDGTLQQPHLLSQQRYFVKATQPIGATFTVSSGSITKEIRVNVIPVSLPVTASGGNGTTEPTAISSENFVFDDNTTFSLNGIDLPYLGASDGGHTANVIIPAGFSNETLTVVGAKASYLPTLGLPALESADPISGPSSSAAMAGTGDPNSAPTITLPDSGPYGFGDTGPFTYVDDIYEGSGSTVKFYKIVVPTDRNGAHISLNWTPGDQNADLDVFLTDLDFHEIGSAANGNGSGVPPETFTADIPAGTYLLGVVNWVNRTPPPFVLFSIR